MCTGRKKLRSSGVPGPWDSWPHPIDETRQAAAVSLGQLATPGDEDVIQELLQCLQALPVRKRLHMVALAYKL